MDVVLLDVEGTTTPIEFVHRTLFAFARDRALAFLAAHASDPEVDTVLSGLREEHGSDDAHGHSPPPWCDDQAHARLESAAAYIRWLIDRDRKSRWLKELQGRIWEGGFLGGTLRGEVYSDVPVALERWTAAGARVGIFSSGSVLAQRLLFAHSTAGDLTPFLRWHFDTAVGPKTEPASYARIAGDVAASPARLLFVSDVTKELDAARAASLQTLLCVRPPAEPPVNAGRYTIVRTFFEIVP